MKKIMLAVLPALVLSFAAPVAHADDDPNSTSPATAANNWNFAEAAVCLQEVAVVPGGYTAEDAPNCSNGNVINHP